MKKKLATRRTALLMLLVTTIIFYRSEDASATAALLSKQSVYVPIYSHIYHGDREKPFYLAATISIRNTDPKRDITLISADYHDSNGKLLKKYIVKPIRLKKLATIRYIIKSSDKSGGSGAKFIVRWKSAEPVNIPLIEAIMVNTRVQGLSFISRGRAIEE